MKNETSKHQVPKVVFFRTLLAAMLPLCLSLLGCGEPATNGHDQQEGNTRPLIAATNAALASMTQAILGDTADVICARPQDDTTAGLSSEVVLQLQTALIVFTNGPGADDAAWLNLVSIDQEKIHATTNDEFEHSDFILVEDFRTVHSHGDEGEHSHPWLVPQCWLNPRFAQSQAVSVLNRLKLEFPEHKSLFEANFVSVTNELTKIGALADETAALLGRHEIETIASDPRLLFFTRALKQADNYFVWFDLPTSADAVALVKQRKADRGLLLWAQPPGDLKHPIAETGIAQVTIDLIETEQPGEYLQALRKNFLAIQSAIESAIQSTMVEKTD